MVVKMWSDFFFSVCKIGREKRHIENEYILHQRLWGFFLHYAEKCTEINAGFRCLFIVSHVSPTTVTNHWNYSWREFCLCLHVSQYFITSEILQATSDDICPRSTSTSSVHLHTHWYTHVHAHCSTRRHAAGPTDTLIFNGIIHFLGRPPYHPPSCSERSMNMPETWRMASALFGIHAESVIRERDKSTFIHRGAHEWRGPTLLTGKHDTAEYK